MIDVNKMCIITSLLITPHFKGTIFFTHFSDERMAKWQVSVTVSKFCANFPHTLKICAVLRLTYVYVTSG